MKKMIALTTVAAMCLSLAACSVSTSSKTPETTTAAATEAEKKEETVLVNYRLEEGEWVFDGSNSLLQAAMLGYLRIPE